MSTAKRLVTSPGKEIVKLWEKKKNGQKRTWQAGYPESLDDKQTTEHQKSGTKHPRADSSATNRQVGQPSMLKAAAIHPTQQLLTFTPSTSQEPTQTQNTQEMNTDEG